MHARRLLSCMRTASLNLPHALGLFLLVGIVERRSIFLWLSLLLLLRHYILLLASQAVLLKFSRVAWLVAIVNNEGWLVDVQMGRGGGVVQVRLTVGSRAVLPSVDARLAVHRLLQLPLVLLCQEALELLLTHLLLCLLGSLGLHLYTGSLSAFLVHLLVLIHQLLLQFIVLRRTVVEVCLLLQVLSFLFVVDDVGGSPLQLRFHALELPYLLLLQVLNLFLNGKLVLFALPGVVFLGLA